MKNIKVVIGSNFGDEGKGLATDYFANEAIKKNESCIVVCCNGGAQKGHTITTPEGLRHITHHFGSGVLIGADTYLSDDFIINPILFRQEREELIKKGIKPNKVYANYNCIITTPYDMLINQIIEEFRHCDKHGSCGLGIYETIVRNNSINLTGHYLQHGKDIKADFEDILLNIRNEYLPRRLSELGVTNIPDNLVNIVYSNMLISNYLSDINYLHNNIEIVRNDKCILDKYNTVIFECSQGLLLDKNNTEYFPNLTPSNTGIVNPMKVINNIQNDRDIEICYVTRSYMTRHGAGRFDSECNKSLIAENIVDLTNMPNPFQDNIRYGKLDLSLLFHTINNDLNKIPNKINYKSSLMITHLNETNNKLVCMDVDININNKEISETLLQLFNNVYLSSGMSREFITRCNEMKREFD